MIINPKIAIQKGWITSPGDLQIQPNSIDLTIDSVYRISSGIILHADGSRQLPDYTRELWVRDRRPDRDDEMADYHVFRPGRFYQVEFCESVRLPQTVCALTLMRSSMNKSASGGEVGHFDSGYEGRVGITVRPEFRSMVEVGATIAQILFFESSASRPYNGYYVNQDWPNTAVES